MRSKAQVRLSRIGIVLLVALLFTALIPISARATTITFISPTQGFVGDTVHVVGQIDTLGGKWSLFFDTILANFGSAPSNSRVVDTTFVVPEATGSDAGQNHAVKLSDNATTKSDAGTFAVMTKRVVSADPARVGGEGLDTTITVKVTGGIAGATYSFNVDVSDPTGASHRGMVTFSANPVGTGSKSILYPTAFPPSSGANTNFVGTYGIVASETAPGSMPRASANFLTGLTDATSYQRFLHVSYRSAGWKAGEEVLVDIKTGGISAKIGSVSYPIKEIANSAGMVSNSTPMVQVDLATGTYAITVANSTGNPQFKPTIKPVPDAQDLGITPSTKIAVVLVHDVPVSLQRTLTATAKFRITYPDGSLVDASRLGSITASVLNASGVKVADISLLASDFDRTPAQMNWNASWKIPKGAALENHALNILAGAVVDKFGNNGPTGAVASGMVTVQLAQLAVSISGNIASGATFNRTATVAMKFQAQYPDKSFFSPTDLGSAVVNVSLAGKDITRLPLSGAAFDAATGNWTAMWTIPFNAALSSQYNLVIRSGKIADLFENSNVVDTSSRSFQVVPVTLIVPALATDKASYQRDQQVFFSFGASYLDGSPVTTGSAMIALTGPNGGVGTLTATFDSLRGVFVASRVLSAVDPLGTYTATLAVNGLVDGATPPDSNMGPNAIRSVSFLVVPAVQVIQVNVDVGSLYFAGETAQFTVLTANLGTPIDASITASLIKPDGGSVALTPQRVDVGVNRISFALPSGAASGTYTLVVRASAALAGAEGRGTAIGSFLVSSSLSDLNARVTQIQGGVATIQTSLGTVMRSLDSINAHLTSIDGTQATIQSDIGTLKTDVSTINAHLTSIDGNVATVQSDIGTLKTSVSSINAHLTSIDGGIATIQTSVGTLQTSVSAINAKVTDISNGVATIQTSVGTLQTSVSAINAKVTDISNGVATIQTSVGTLQTSVSAINARVTSIQGDQVIIKTDVGTLKTDVAAIKPVVTRIDGNVATVQTSVGTLQGTVTSIQGDVATIKTAVGDLKAPVSTAAGVSTSVSNVLNLLYVVTALALIAALGAIAAVAVISRRLTK